MTQANPSPYDWIDDSLTAIHRAHWYRSVKTISSQAGPVIALEGKSVLNFASNDYLGRAMALAAQALGS
jgi:8-amino-7-oxononanoate synthase